MDGDGCTNSRCPNPPERNPFADVFLANSHTAEAALLKARIKALEDALRPFAEHLLPSNDTPDDRVAHAFYFPNWTHMLTYGDFRTAARVLKGESEGG